MPPGAVIGRYIVLNKIGAGGMGVVYAAHDPDLDRKVALKLLVTPGGDAAARDRAAARMLREARAMAKLSHPNVITVHDVGTFEGRIFVAMELVRGVTLATWLHKQQRSWRDVLRVFHRAGEGLAAAHAAGLVHRDFKPDNVLVDEEGRVRVLDFGLARTAVQPPEERTQPEPVETPRPDLATAATAAVPAGAGPQDPDLVETLPAPSSGVSAPRSDPLAVSVTAAGTIMGTPLYMSPEQYAAMPLDPRTDQYSFCVALYEGLYGRPPFDGATLLELKQRVLEGRIEPLPRGTRVPGAIQRVLLRGLSVDPAHRYPSMEELLANLDQAAGIGRRRWLAGASAAVALAATFGFLRLMTRGNAGGGPHASTVEHRRITFRGDASAPVFSPDGGSIVYVAGKKLIVRDIQSGGERELYAGDQPSEPRWLPGAAEITFRDPAPPTLYVIASDGGAPRTAPPLFDGTFSSDGAEGVIYDTSSKQLTIVDAHGDIEKPKRRISLNGEFLWLDEVQWSPSGRWLLALTSDSAEGHWFWVVRSDGGLQRKLLDEVGDVTSPRWAPRDNAFYFRRGLPTAATDVVKVAFDAGTGEARGAPRVLLGGLDMGRSFSISPDGKRFAYGRERRRTTLWTITLEGSDDAKAARPAKLDAGITLKSGLSVSPDGTRIAFGQTGSGANVFTIALGGGPPKQTSFLSDVARVPSTAWSPDGAEIVFSTIMRDGSTRLWRVPAGGGEARPVGHGSPGEGVAWCPGRGILYQTSGNRNFNVVDPATGAEAALLSKEIGWIFAPRCSPDGEHLATLWNRAGDEPRGLWVLSRGDGSSRLLAPDLLPLGYGDDGRVIYAVNPDRPRELFQVPAGGGAPSRVAELPFEQPVDEIAIVPGTRRFVCSMSDVDSDIWFAESFDPEVSAR